MKHLTALALATLALTPAAFAQEDATPWQQQKCAIYERAWGEALASIGSDDINYNFLAANENFIVSGCIRQVDACARSDQELEIANFLSLVMINEGAASTFLPFRCPPE